MTSTNISFQKYNETYFTFLDSFSSNIFSENIFWKYHEHDLTYPNFLTPQRRVRTGKRISPYQWESKQIRNFRRSNEMIEQTVVEKECKFDQMKNITCLAIFVIKKIAAFNSTNIICSITSQYINS